MPRRADGVWVDANGEVVYRSDPNDTGVDRSKATFRDGFWIDNATGQKIPNRNYLPARVPGTKAGAPGSTVWPDGTPVTPEQHAEINKQAGGPGEGGQQPGWVDAVLGVVSGGMIPTVQGIGSVINASQGKPSSFWAGNFPGQTTGSEPSEGAPNYGITGFADPSQATNNYLSPEAPGGELDTRQPDADRQRMAEYLAQLQGQAQTGGGAWEGQLAQATQQGAAATTALGQSVAGIDPMTAQRNIGNARAGVQQRAVGQAETLRAQTKQNAQQQLAGIYSAQGSLDAQQAAEEAAARQGRREANQAITDEANKTNTGIYSGVAQGVTSLLSEGGPVPGKAQVFGDDTANDTVPAMLSPGEIVLPRSVTNSSDPASAAAAFVQAVKEHHGAQNYDNGGQVPKDPWATKPDTDAGDALPMLANDPTVTDAGNARFMGIGTPQQAASVRNGGLLDTTAYNASREATLGSTQAFLDAFGGRGPSVAPQLTRTSTDENIAGAMAAQAGARGAGRQASAGLIGGQAAAGQGEIAGRAAGTAAQEATQGGQSYAAAIQKQRQMDLAFALAQQQAMWRNSMANAGIGLASQAQMRGLLGGVGQAFAAGANALGNAGKDFDGFGADPEAQAAGDEWDTDISPGSAEGDWNTDSPSWDSDTGTAYAAHGGEIPDRAFTRAAGYADGGEVSWQERAKKAFSMAAPILAGRGGPWAGAQGAAGMVGDQMRGQLEDEAVMRAQPDPRYSPEQAFDIETTNPVKTAALDRLSLGAAQLGGTISEVATPTKTVLQGIVSKLKDKGGVIYGTTKDKAWIGDLYEQLNKEGYEMSRPQFEKLLLDAHRSGDLNLSRQDMVVGADKKKSATSEVKGAAGSQFHRVDLPENFADGGEVDGLDAGTELAGPRDAGVLQAPPFTASVQPPGPMPVAAPLAPPRPGLPMAAPRAQPRAMQAEPAAPDAFALEQQAVAAESAANEEAGRAKAEALIGAQKAIERAGIERQEAHARAKMSADADMARILETRQQLAAESSTVDPGRWWASRSTPGKIAAAIGLALGAIGAGNDGVNRAVGIIENAIGRDLEAQKAEHQIRLRKGQMAVESAQSIYSLNRQAAQDDISASDASVATALQIARNQAEIATARASSPLAKAQGQAVIAQLDQKRDAHDAATRQRAIDNRIKLEDMETRRIAAQRERASQAGRDFVAPGYKLMPGAAPKVEELGKWRDALAEKRNTDATTKKLKDLINKSSFTPLGEDAAQAQSLISDLKVSYKNMATLGALSGSDYALIDAAIPDPTSLKGHFTPDKTLNSRLDQFAKTAAVKLDNKASVLGVVRADEAGAEGGGGRRMQRNKKTGEVRYINPDGSIEMVR